VVAKIAGVSVLTVIGTTRNELIRWAAVLDRSGEGRWVVTLTASVFTVQSTSTGDIDCTAQGGRNESASFTVVGCIPMLRLVFDFEQRRIPAVSSCSAEPGPGSLQLHC
jgi:hypothetical protein